MKHMVCAVSAVLVIVSSACTDAPRPSAAYASRFTDGVCESISAWSDELVDIANAFIDLSPHLSIEGRRAQYLFAFDRQERLTDDLREQLAAAPAIGVADAATLRAVLLRATDDVVQNIRSNRVDASEHVDFETIGPKPDRLFAGTEKSLSLMLKPLDELARDQRVEALAGSCGR